MSNHNKLKFDFDKLIREKQFYIDKLKYDMKLVQSGDYEDKT